ncbi:MAG TPA: hypothetical protein VKB57_15720 [Acidimicrobiales bacterium]|nr:hypothetical protein [Acidimicrobiales bacterium]
MDDERSDVLSTYRHLRLAMPLLLGMLLVAVALRALSAPNGVCFEGSISAYYFTSVRAVFVAALAALGACLIIYRGNTPGEDIALNVSGALAFVVAFVPTHTPRAMGVACSATNVPNMHELDEAVTNNVWALIIVTFAAIVLAMYLLGRSSKEGDERRALWVQLWAFLAVLALGTAAFVVWPDGFRDNAHLVAAFGTFIGIVIVVALNAFHLGGVSGPAPDGLEPRQTFARTMYVLIVTAMVLTMVVVGVLYRVVSGWRHGALWIEALLIVEFLVFWVVQTYELWPTTRRYARPASA